MIFIVANGYKSIAGGREVYLNDWYSTSPEKLLIEVQVPVIPR